MSKRNAIITGAALVVCCPYCGEPHPSPDNGSDLWFPSQVKASEGDRQCVACDKWFKLQAQSRVTVGVG